MSKFSNVAAFALLAAIAANTVYAAGATVNGTAIPQARIDMRVKAAAKQGQPDSPELRKAIRDDLINMEVISQEASKKGLDKEPEVAQQIEILKQTTLVGAFVLDFAKTHPVAEAAIKQAYETMKTRVGNKEFKVSHILVATEKEALAIAADLKKKDNFAKIAKEKSKDPGSKDKGGDLGWTVPSNFVQPFGDAVQKLTKGQLSAPVQTQFGWHVIKLEDTRALKVPSYDEVKPSIEKQLQQQAIQEAVRAMRANAKIED